MASLLPDAAPAGSAGDPVFSPLLVVHCQCTGCPFYEGECCSLIRRRDGDLANEPHPISGSKLSRVGLLLPCLAIPQRTGENSPFMISAKRVAPINRNHRDNSRAFLAEEP